jgi:hypothetical protein
MSSTYHQNREITRFHLSPAILLVDPENSKLPMRTFGVESGATPAFVQPWQHEFTHGIPRRRQRSFIRDPPGPTSSGDSSLEFFVQRLRGGNGVGKFWWSCFLAARFYFYARSGVALKNKFPGALSAKPKMLDRGLFLRRLMTCVKLGKTD